MNKFSSQENLCKIAQIIKSRDNFLICGHVSPDGDCIGSQTALSLSLKSLGKNAINLLVNTDSIDKSFLFMGDSDNFVNSEKYSPEFDEYCFICVDVQPSHRIGEAALAMHDNAETTITIDHHMPEITSDDYVYINSKSASNSLNIFDLIKLLDVEITEELATSVYTGLCGDTNSFCNVNSDKKAFEYAAEIVSYGANVPLVAKQLFQTRSLNSFIIEKIALDRMYVDEENRFAVSYIDDAVFQRLGATTSDSHMIIDVLRDLDVADVVCVIRKVTPDGSIKGSLRAKTDIDVSKLAKCYVGGGHKAASGFTMPHTDIIEAFAEVKVKLAELMQGKI